MIQVIPVNTGMMFCSHRNYIPLFDWARVGGITSNIVYTKIIYPTHTLFPDNLSYIYLDVTRGCFNVCIVSARFIVIVGLNYNSTSLMSLPDLF